MFGSDYQAASSRREHVASLINRKVGQHGILIGSLKCNSIDDASPRVRPRGHRARKSRTCATAFMEARLTSMATAIKRSRGQKRIARIYESAKKGVSGYEGSSSNFFSSRLHVSRSECLQPYPGPHRIRMFLSLRIKRSF